MIEDRSIPKFTPGPWHCSPEADLHRIGVYVGTGDDVIICDVSDEDVEADGECEANARLIAAAPDLYAACRELMEWLEFNGFKGGRMERARAALAKAEKGGGA